MSPFYFSAVYFPPPYLLLLPFLSTSFSHLFSSPLLFSPPFPSQSLLSPKHYLYYYIVGNFQGRNFQEFVENFCGENFHGLLACAAPKDTTPPNFAEKTFVISHKTLKFANIFSVESLRDFRFDPKLHDYALFPTQHYIYNKNTMHMHNVHCTKAFILIHLEGLLG